MTKTIKQKFTLQDFLIPTLSDEPSKLFLIKDGVKTKEHLLIISSEHSSLRRAKIKWAMAENTAIAEAKLIEDKVDQNLHYTESKLISDIEYASQMVVGWSLGHFDTDNVDLLLENNGQLASAIISHAYDSGEYAVKK